MSADNARAAEDRLNERDDAYANGRWCGACRYGWVEDPPCCFHPGDRVSVEVGGGS